MPKKGQEQARDREEKVAGSDWFINLTLNYLLHFTCVCVCGLCRQWNRDNVRKDNGTARSVETIG